MSGAEVPLVGGDRTGTFVDAYGADIDPGCAIEYAKARERDRFARNGWPVDF